jgi:hypothetical protein
MLAGSIAGFCQVVATNPMEIVKIQMQLSANSSNPQNALEIVQRLSLRGLYTGTTATLMRDVPFSMLFFSGVSILKDLGTKKGEKTPLKIVFLSGILSGGLAAAMVTPMDVVKTRLQTQGQTSYSGQLDCYK